MSLVLKLHPNGRSLICETERGGSVPLPSALGDVGPRLVALLQEQAKPKVIAPGVDGDVMALVLAEWERVGHPGDGRGLRRRVAAQAEPGVRIFTKSGKELLPL
jgi:hypothetical protein